MFQEVSYWLTSFFLLVGQKRLSNRSLVIAWPCHSLSDSLTNDLKSYVTLTDEDTRSKVVGNSITREFSLFGYSLELLSLQLSSDPSPIIGNACH